MKGIHFFYPLNDGACSDLPVLMTFLFPAPTLPELQADAGREGRWFFFEWTTTPKLLAGGVFLAQGSWACDFLCATVLKSPALRGGVRFWKALFSYL